MSNKTLVAYFTKSGASEEYAKVIADVLSEKGISVEIYNLAEKIPDITAFDIIVLGTGVRMFMVYRRWRKILKHKALKNKHLFMFLSSGMAMEEPDKAVEKFLRPLVQKYDLSPDSLVSFPGKIPEKWEKYDEGPKAKMDPDKAKEWAKEIARLVQKNR